MRRLARHVTTTTFLMAALAAVSHAQTAASPAKPAMPPVCGVCHKPEAGVVRGYFESVAFKSQSMQLGLGSATEIIRFDPNRIRVFDAGDAKDVEHLRDVAVNREARIEFVDNGGVKTATAIDFKGPIKTPPDKLVAYPEVARLVALGPEKGGYTLIDSRPLPRFQEGTIPGAVNLPFPQFDKFADRLPADKGRLLVFFCQGVTCMMSPSSLRRAEAMGYTNARVYREGWPEWTEKNVGVLSAQHLKEAWLDKSIPHVLIDARAPLDVARGHIRGAVALAPDQVARALNGFPAKALKAPFMVYDRGDGKAAMAVAQQITAAGYPLVNVIPGGLEAWTRAGFPTEAGVPSTRVAYVPALRPGQITNDEFRRIAAATPSGTLILDVRNRDEANAGMIPGAMLVPDDEIAARMAEIPRDRRIVTHCSTGIRAEMAYHKLKAAGYDVGFVKAELEIDKKGAVRIKG